MTQPPSPASSSSYSCVSDSSDTSNDSGVESMSSAGSLHPDYMDIDEFLYASGREHFSQESPNDFANRFVCQCQENHSPQVQFQQNELKNEVLIYTNNDTELNSKEEVQNKPPEKKESKPKSNSKRQHSGYSYNYNPMPMGKKANRRFVPEEGKDQKYWKRRNKNNEAARRSRDMRRQREIEISAHWKELEKENERLKKELQKLKERANDLEKELLEKQS